MFFVRVVRRMFHVYKHVFLVGRLTRDVNKCWSVLSARLCVWSCVAWFFIVLCRVVSCPYDELCCVGVSLFCVVF